jgi:hypothetical protein
VIRIGPGPGFIQSVPVAVKEYQRVSVSSTIPGPRMYFVMFAEIKNQGHSRPWPRMSISITTGDLMKPKEYQSIWHKLIDERVKDKCYQAIAEKLKRIKFDRAGEMKPGKLTLYAKRHFPNLIELYKIRSQAAEIPKRKMRTRAQPFSPKRDQMNMFKSNQLDLF